MALELPLTIESPDGTEVNYQISYMAANTVTVPRLEIGYDASTADVTYWCRGDQLDQFLFSMLGQDNVDTEPDAKYPGISERLFRYLPQQLPIYNMNGNMWASKAVNIQGIPGKRIDYDEWNGTGERIYVENDEFEPLEYPIYNGARNDIEYAYYEVTIKFEPVPYPVLTDEETPRTQEWLRFTSIRRTPRLEYLNVQGNIMFWIDSPVKSSPEPLPHNVPIRDQSIDYIVTWHRLPFPITDFPSYAGYANSLDGFLDGHPQAPIGGFSKERMLLVGVTENIKPIWYTQNHYYEYQMYFTDRFNGHNQARRPNRTTTPATFDYNAFSVDGKTPATNATRIVKLANMNQLFLARAIT